MLATYLIGLREGLEAGLIVGILVAYLGKLGRRDLLGRLWVGVGLAIAVSLGVGALLTWGPYALTFQAQEILGGVLSIIAVAMVTWMIFWMGNHGSSLSRELRGQVDAAVDRSRFAIVLLGALSVGREGVETALFVWANVAGGSEPMLATLGAVLGIATAIGISWGLSKGLVKFNLSVFFTWTGVFLIVVAAGVLAYGIGDLQEASVIPGWGAPAWSLTGIVQPGSVLDTVLGGIFNFTPEPTWAQVIGWVAYVAITLSLYLWMLQRRNRSAVAAATRPASVAPAAAAAPAAVVAPSTTEIRSTQ
ncbi:high-affinity Fe2+/Pb2+ permease [Agromyces intestinalis]|uniref:High-affinity Fe2+/Pb2+ permease n=1 Tax=Agromyces intestinalis TaxID=2592652 RepID=A0A5C1YFT7_9MICO|nr:iron uptake transporter permease EfeU [Agromyces intestinalis]QEO14385.1 high-affinity Fe2+/Pb2+ permease [Agromyces intestinalis]